MRAFLGGNAEEHDRTRRSDERPVLPTGKTCLRRRRMPGSPNHGIATNARGFIGHSRACTGGTEVSPAVAPKASPVVQSFSAGVPRVTRARVSIGIDLGTTNTALAFVPLAGDGPSEMLPIPQLESAVALVDAPTLPSFLYLPENNATVSDSDDENAGFDRWAIGRFARARAGETPGRVVHSAKSWLAHHSADRSARFLPWGSDDVARDDKLSPVEASALILRYLREAWNDRFAAAGADFAFDAQIVTITVPASFDAAAQRLTLEAARGAGYPDAVRLLEEPQAALYRWLEQRDPATPWREAFATGGAEPYHVVVVDIGGGTSDFSLFAFHTADGGGEPRIERVAVSEHILLGGDNMDLALAHRLEPLLVDDGENLSGRRWDALVARSRDLKETALATDGAPDDAYSVSIPGRGSRLIAQAASARITRVEIERLLIGGFFPACSADEYPIRTKAALRELGLPYARDPAVTRHLADFLRGRPAVDAVLFNGGALHPQRLRERLRAQIGSWQSGRMPAVLENHEPDVAVARGAARFGKLVYARAERIEAGAAHAIFLQAERPAGGDAHAGSAALVCVLPKGAPTEKTFSLSEPALELRVNAPVRFAAYSSARHPNEEAGAVVDWNERDFVALPSLETAITVGLRSGSTRTGANANCEGAEQTLPVRLTARLGELGQLEIACVSSDPNIGGTWPLEFNLRGEAATATGESMTRPTGAAIAAGPNVSPETLDAARTRIATIFGRSLDARDKLTATRLLKSLEGILGVPKAGWNAALVRSLWSALAQCMDDRETSPEHEEAWLILAGFLLRPGFGVPLDDTRIDRLWHVHEAGLAFSTKTVQIATYVMWRRVSGGLAAERQERVLAPELAKIRDQPQPPPELVLLAGSLERIALDVKAELIDRFLATATTLEREQKHNAHMLGALGALLNRAPLYGGPEIVVPPEFVQRAFEALSRFDWDGPKHLELQTLFLRAARVVDNRSIDVSRSLRHRIAEKLERAGVPASKTAPLKDYMPLQRAERAGSFGESLPPGLILRDRPLEGKPF